MKALSIAFALLVAAPAAQAASNLIFFGGSGAQASVMSSCYRNSKNYGYPADGSLASVVAALNKSPDKKFVLAGHSSGSKYLMQVARRVKNPERLTLVDLDGYAPVGAPRGVHTVCWRATNGHGLNSRNFNVMTKSNGCQEVHTITAPTCKTAWCLHFALVNQSAPANLGDATFISQGYSRCQPNQKWAEAAGVTNGDDIQTAKSDAAHLGYIETVLKKPPPPVPATAVVQDARKVKKEPAPYQSGNSDLTKPSVDSGLLFDDHSVSGK